MRPNRKWWVATGKITGIWMGIAFLKYLRGDAIVIQTMTLIGLATVFLFIPALEWSKAFRK